jgi:hypothetical protein
VGHFVLACPRGTPKTQLNFSLFVFSLGVNQKQRTNDHDILDDVLAY